MTIKPISDRTYRNPLPYEDGGTHTAPDPFVIRYRDRYYCYATDEQGVLVSTSLDMTRWTAPTYAYVEEGRCNFWAPSVILSNGMFYMYVSNMPENETDPHTGIMRVAVSANPLGPFEKRAELFDTFAIDSQVVYGDDGQLYLLYADNQEMGLSEYRPGTSVMVDRLSTPYRREGHPRPLITPSMDEEIFARNRFGDGRDWHTVEGATYFTHRNSAYITYSGNAYEHEDYFIGYAHAELPENPADAHIDQLEWVKQRNNGCFDPLLIRSSQVEGTGHNSIVRAPNGVDDWIVYHGRNTADELHVGTEQRVMRADPLYYGEDGLDSRGPSAAECDAPLAATVSADFSEGVPVEWTIVHGTATSDRDNHGALLRTCDSGRFMAVSDVHEPFGTVHMSVWARVAHTPLGERFGVVARYRDECNFTLMEIHTGKAAIRVVDVINGVSTIRGEVSLNDIDPRYWHEYRVERAWEHCRVLIDGRRFLDVTVDGGEGAVGLWAIGTAACFSAFVATDHVDLWGDSISDLCRELTPDRQMAAEHGELCPVGVQSAVATLRHSVIGNRFVVDFLIHGDRGQVTIAVDRYRLSMSRHKVCLLADGQRIEPVACPERLRALADEPRFDLQGRTLRTVRIGAGGGVLTIHMRGNEWQVPLNVEGTPLVVVILDDAALTGYTRTAFATRKERAEGKEGKVAD